MNITNLTSRVMLATLNISVWRARRFDTRATQEVEAKHEAKDIGRFNKRLLTDGATSYKEVCAIGNRARALFDSHSLDYDQLGVRLLPTAVYMDVAEKLRALGDQFDAATAQFLADYPRLKDEARVALNGLFDEADYPTEAELRRKFGVRFSVLPFPDASQFGIDLPPDVLHGIREEMDAKVLGAVKTANNDLVSRLYEAVQHFANRLYGEGNVRLDVADKVRELSALLPRLNFSDDPVLTEILAKTQEQLACYTGAQLKDDPLLRLNVAERAMEIEAQMAAFMGGPPPTLTREGGDMPMLHLLAA
ncbi:conserved protein of unknown function (plasmid) [Cupriavidus taiwanensis]|uniref:DUF3150 domain-containing protein n=1 Tax=Cupriavidus taiwanensis TaxID=164546 RepID=A0A375FLS0_9BURK|nr:hypothetical protein [Cupriavidus taiwanensis]SOZ72654.1 conserved hypothetical protein [Cupriavidus taiwanensis]SOZ73313.1 conserved hypothetical protein [Cupriavidus taiwanensis]SOZ75189.1 conserved hypothetical protein [Cupriavidus taiwanensis]SPA03703.1 conserved protein of unknown function [Cupriavidus taiwanensis]SPA11606.1 conserved protein of unknown function [Cupriavidus taiwanensis]